MKRKLPDEQRARFAALVGKDPNRNLLIQRFEEASPTAKLAMLTSLERLNGAEDRPRP
jgi:hypothetical protein